MAQWADELHLASQGGPTVSAWPGLSLPEAYAVAARNHARRVAEGDAPLGRKIGHTNPANWPTLGLSAPSWGWLYRARTWTDVPLPSGERWREPKVELELVLRLGAPPAPGAPLEAWARCVDAVALGLEFVDRPYAAWGGSVADSVAAGGVHAGLWMGPVRTSTPVLARAWGDLRAHLQVGEASSQGSSAAVMGHPLAAVAALQSLLAQQGAAPLQAGEWITTGALAPALPYRPGAPISALIEGPGFRLSV